MKAQKIKNFLAPKNPNRDFCGNNNQNAKQLTSIIIGVPVESMNPVYSRIDWDRDYQKDVQDVLDNFGGKAGAEIKYDGYRFQLHKKGDLIAAFTREFNPYIMDLYPELMPSIRHLPDCVLDCELNGGGTKKDFEKVRKRFRVKISKKSLESYLASGIVEEHPLNLNVFDVLHFEGIDYFNIPLSERRKRVEAIDEEKIKPTVQSIVAAPAELKALFDATIMQKGEGLVVKNLNSVYIPGHNPNWIKLKTFETLDLVVLGLYEESGELTQALVGCYNPAKSAYETIAKVNLKREGINSEVAKALSKKKRKSKPANIAVNPALKADSTNWPAFFISPEKSVVLEVKALNIMRGKNWHSCGYDDSTAYSLRIGWTKGIRYDKNVSQATSLAEVERLYSMYGGEDHD